MKSTSTISKDSITSLTIGGFDGIHLAHRELIKKAQALMIVSKYNSNLTPKEYRCKFVKKPCFFYELEKIKKFDCDEFAKFLKNEFPSLKKVVVGYDFRYGYKRACGIDDLKSYFEVEVVDEILLDGISVHSGVIRKFISKGEIEKADKLLGRAYSIEGRVIKGQGIGKNELVPTINVSVCDFLLPQNGVYATKCRINKKVYNSVTFIGIRESTDGCFSIEIHIIDKEIKSVGKNVEIFFYKRIRDNKKFNSLKELKEQIKKDIKMAKEILNETFHYFYQNHKQG